MIDEHSLFAEQVRRLIDLGPRPSGSDAHRALVEDVAADLTALGLDVHRDPHRFERWEVDPESLGLRIGDRRVPVSSAWPYSGETPAAGVTAPLALLSGLRKNWKAAAGKIAVIEVENFPVPASLLVESWGGGVPFEDVTNPVVGSELAGTDLTRAKAAGALGVIAAWRGLSDAAARGQYLPFTRGYQGLPAVWVPESERDDVLAAARRGDTATLTLHAARDPHASMDTLWAVSPGSGPRATESVLVVTHSDGGNAVEENGHIGLLALARAAADAPHDRSIVFVFTAGHLRIPAVTSHGQATTAWLEAHPELWSGATGGLSAVAGLVLEHLGAKHLRVDPTTGAYEADGTLEPELLYATTAELAQLTRTAWRGADPHAATPIRPGAVIHFGEGEPLFEHRIPTVALVTGPEYLLAETTADIVDIDALARQVESFRALQQHLAGSADRATFGTVRLPSKLAKLRALARIGWFLLRRRG